MDATNVVEGVEIWKDIAGYEGYYQVSSLGRVKSLERTFASGIGLRNVQTYPEKMINRQAYKSGYMYVVLCKDGLAKKYKVHRLVALAFIPNPEEKPQVEHDNTIRSDNRLKNLSWVTPSENMANPNSKESQSASKRGEKNPMKKKRKTVLQIDMATNEVIKTWLGTKEPAKQLGIDASNISRCCTGQKVHHKGFIWKYAE